MRPDTRDQVLRLLLTEAQGLGEPEIRGRLPARISQPTLRSRRLHQYVAERLAREPALRDLARDRLERLRQVNPHGRRYHDRWAELLDGPLPALLSTLTEASAQSDDLRKESPFTTLVDAPTRERIFRSIRAA